MNATNYITQEGWDKLNKEMEELWAERKIVTEAVGEAAAMGDRSENAEYIYGKKKLRELDRRIGYLHRRFKALQIYKPAITEPLKVYFGSYVTFKDQTGRSMTFRIVGQDEADIKEQTISLTSPIGKALLHKNQGEDVEANTPVGKKVFTIVEVKN